MRSPLWGYMYIHTYNHVTSYFRYLIHLILYNFHAKEANIHLSQKLKERKKTTTKRDSRNLCWAMCTETVEIVFQQSGKFRKKGVFEKHVPKSNQHQFMLGTQINIKFNRTSLVFAVRHTCRRHCRGHKDWGKQIYIHFPMTFKSWPGHFKICKSMRNCESNVFAILAFSYFLLYK